jgi:murein L,D-transpeptidase YcbB/YkuD
MTNVDCDRARAGASRSRLRGVLAVGLLALLPLELPAQSPTASDVRAAIEQLRADGLLRAGGASVQVDPVLIAFYTNHGYTPAWSAPTTVASLERAIAGARDDGLDAADYYQAEIARSNAAMHATDARIDILRSAALIKLARHLRYGKLHSQYPAGDTAMDAAEMAAQLRFVVTSGVVQQAVVSLRPDHFTYQGLLRSLAELRRVHDRGGWPVLQVAAPLRAGDTGASVRALRERLVREGYTAAAGAGADSVFDAALRDQLALFQHRHALTEDGVLGQATLAELNVSVQRRIDQVRVNLERARWITHDLPDRFVGVNIAGAKVYLVRRDSVVFEARAVVGQEYTRTPVFRAAMTHIELNPTWTVPRSIVDEVFAAVRRDPQYLARMNMHVLDQAGRQLRVSAHDLLSMSAQSFPYTLRQDPGPANPLGGIKFVLPNRYNVYLHDTPARSLFEKDTRTFSHGCIRVERPVQLAASIFEDARWDQPSLEAEIRAGKTVRIPLSNPLPVLVLYWTASADLHGELHYYRDVYQRDASVLQALKGVAAADNAALRSDFTNR